MKFLSSVIRNCCLSCHHPIYRLPALSYSVVGNGELNYNYNSQRTHTCGELDLSDVGKEVKLCGWLRFKRLMFLLIWDCYGITQVIADDKNEKLKLVANNLHLESVISVEGTVRARPERDINRKYATGEIEILAKSITVISGTLPETLPFSPKGYEVPEGLFNRFRPLGLRFDKYQKNLRLYAKVESAMRNFLESNDFINIGTPTLFKKTPGGAQEYVVPTRYKDRYFSLVQSPQQFKQMLMIAGFDRYYQFARCYRDERTTRDRQPEFTQLDLEMSFTTREDIMKLVEDVLLAAWPKSLLQIVIPFPTITFSEAKELYGTDKPHFLDHCKIQDLSEYFDHTEETCSRIFVLPGVANCLTEVNDVISSLDLPNTLFLVIPVNLNLQSVASQIAPRVSGFDAKRFEEKAHALVGDIIVFASGTKAGVLKTLGTIRREVLKMFAAKEDKEPVYEFIWVVDFPLFEKSKNPNRLIESAHHPFTHPHPEDMHLLDTDPLKMRALHYDLVLNGNEIGGGSIRIHDVDLQKRILNTLQIPEEDFSHLLNFMKIGCPPMGGIALGMDRLIAILCGSETIRDVIAFPKSSEGRDLMSGTPCDIPLRDKVLYHLAPPQKEILEELRAMDELRFFTDEVENASNQFTDEVEKASNQFTDEVEKASNQ